MSALLAIVLFAAQLHSQTTRTVKFIPVDKTVRLEVVDWGGSGRSVVLLAGGGNSAHIFDDFAPKLGAACHAHVYGITRRGFGASGFLAPLNAVDRLRDDVLAVIDALNLTRPILIGHSIAGAEMSAIAAIHPNRVAGLVYLEAGYPYAFASSDGATMQDFLNAQGPVPPSPSTSDLASFAALQKWDAQIYGFPTPESELHQTWDSTQDGRPRAQRDPPGAEMLFSILTSLQRFTDIPAPALAIFAMPHLPEPWIDKGPDNEVRQAAKTYFAAIDALAERQAEALEHVRTVRVVRLRGMHYIFLSNESEVLREIRAFLASLPPA